MQLLSSRFSPFNNRYGLQSYGNSFLGDGYLWKSSYCVEVSWLFFELISLDFKGFLVAITSVHFLEKVKPMQHDCQLQCLYVFNREKCDTKVVEVHFFSNNFIHGVFKIKVFFRWNFWGEQFRFWSLNSTTEFRRIDSIKSITLLVLVVCFFFCEVVVS